MDTVIACLTPPGKAAIATLSVRGPQAWTISDRRRCCEGSLRRRSMLTAGCASRQRDASMLRLSGVIYDVHEGTPARVGPRPQLKPSEADPLSGGYYPNA